MITHKEAEWLIALVKEASGRTTSAPKVTALNNLVEKLGFLHSSIPPLSSSVENIEEAKQLLEKLHDLNMLYSQNSDMTSIEEYDNLKKEFSGSLDYLATLKDSFKIDAEFLEDYLKKELRSVISEDLRLAWEANGEKLSVAQANTLVEIDTTYLNVKKQYQLLYRWATELDTKYKLYMQVWQMVFQSVSTASKARFTQQND